MITEEERDFATEATMAGERLLGQIMVALTLDHAPSKRAQRIAQLMLTAGLITKLEASRHLPDNFGLSLDNVLQQFRDQWGTQGLKGDVDLSKIVIPDADDDFINLASQGAVQ